MYTYCITRYDPKHDTYTTLGWGQKSERIETARKNARYSLSSNKRYYHIGGYETTSSYYALIFKGNHAIGEVRYMRDGTASYESDGSNNVYRLKNDGTLEEFK